MKHLRNPFLLMLVFCAIFHYGDAVIRMLFQDMIIIPFDPVGTIVRFYSVQAIFAVACALPPAVMVWNAAANFWRPFVASSGPIVLFLYFVIEEMVNESFLHYGKLTILTETIIICPLCALCAYLLHKRLLKRKTAGSREYALQMDQ